MGVAKTEDSVGGHGAERRCCIWWDYYGAGSLNLYVDKTFVQLLGALL